MTCDWKTSKECCDFLTPMMSCGADPDCPKKIMEDYLQSHGSLPTDCQSDQVTQDCTFGPAVTDLAAAESCSVVSKVGKGFAMTCDWKTSKECCDFLTPMMSCGADPDCPKKIIEDYLQSHGSLPTDCQ